MLVHLRRGLPVAFLVLSSMAPTAWGGPRPELDVTQGQRPSAASRSFASRAAANEALLKIATPKSMDTRYDVPTMLWAERSAANPTTFANAAVRPSAESAARRHLGLVADFYRLQSADVAAASLRYLHDTGTGGIIAAFTQQIGDVEVFRDEVKVLMDRDLALVAVSGYLPSASLLTRAPSQEFALSPEAAIATAFSDFSGRPANAGSLIAAGAGEAGYRFFDLGAAAAGLPEGVQPGGPVRVRRTYFHTLDALLPAYQLELMAPDQAYAYVVDANDGSLLYRHDLMAFDVFNYRVWAESAGQQRPYDGPQGNSPTPHPTGLPDFFAPGFVASNLKSLQNSPFTPNDPWLAPGASVSTGNNVDAYADLVTPDGFSAGDLRATTTAANTFDRAYDLNQAPGVSSDQRMAAVTQLFYNNNFFHDWYYDAGFNEASGNGQTNNFGRGGLGSDAMRSEVQDFGGTNNANMSTPADGSPGRMQMYLFTPAGQAQLQVAAPPSVAGNYATGVASGFGPQSFNVSGTLIVGVDGIAPTNDGCSGLANVAQVAGKIVMIDRGNCTFVIKAQNAQGAGAIGVIIVDNVSGTTPPGAGGTAGGVTIPVLTLTLAAGNALKAELLNGPFSATMVRQASIARDGSLDNQIVAHEWGHFISNRLVGNAAGLSTNMAGGLGEGWADFHAMLMSIRAEDAFVASNTNWTGVYAMGGYALFPSVGSSNAYYYGIRRVPYSTNLAKNGLTFRHIQDGNALPSAVPTAFGQAGTTNSEVHNAGEVWCTMLWECYAALLNDNVRLTFDQAQTRMKNYLVAAYKMTPNAPTLLEARDALLVAAAAGDAADLQLFWTAFAKRGAGVGAIAPDRFNATNTPVVESFTTGGELQTVSKALVVDFRNCDSDGRLDNGEIGKVTFTFRNTGSGPLTNGTVSVSSSEGTLVFPGGTSFTLPTLAPFQSAAVSVPVELVGASNVRPLDVTASITATGFGVPGVRTATLYAFGNADEAASAFEQVEANTAGWAFAGTPVGDGQWSVQQFANSPSRYFSGPDIGTTADHTLTSPPLQVGPGNFSFSFQHAFDFERDATTFYDGGVVELSTDNGTTWTDIGTSLVPGYTSTLVSGAGSSPLGGRGAYAGQSAGYPALATVNVNLSTTYANQAVRIRFRIGCDAGVGAGGWLLDNLSFTGLLNTPFTTLVTDITDCSPVSVDPAAPRELAFSVTGANPSAGRTTFRFGLPSAQRAELAIFDVSGRRVATLASGTRSAGWHVAAWSVNDDGSAPAAGVYFARLITDSRTIGSRVVMLK